MQYIETMKGALNRAYNALQERNTAIDTAKKRYQPEAARGEIDRINSKFESVVNSSRTTIQNAYDDAINSVKKWAVLYGKNITEDARLLKYDLSPDQFATLVSRHKNNATMCYVLSQYALQHSKSETDDTDSMYYKGVIKQIPTQASKEQAYNLFYSDAMSLLGTISGASITPVFGLKGSVEAFGKLSAFNADLFSVIA